MAAESIPVCFVRVAHPLEDLTALDLDGEPVRLGTLWAKKPVVLVFLRHFG